MKATTFICMTAMTIFAALVTSLQAAAQAQANSLPAPRKYTVRVLPGLGGLGNANSINDRGWVTGVSNAPGDTYDHAFLWREDQATDLGTLGGNNSAGPLNNRNERGWVVGPSETADVDPYQENFAGFICSSPTNSCLPFIQISNGYLWQSKTNKMIALPPLVPPLPGGGGNNSSGSGANNQEIFGLAENGVMDPNCVAPQVFDFEGVVWSLGSDSTPFVSRRLSPIAGDTVSAGLGINEVGDIVGASGSCAPPNFAIGIHAVLWKKDGTVIDLGTLGGTTNNTAVAINNQGQVVGNSGLPSDICSQNFPNCFHAFLWKEVGGMQDLGALPGDDISGASAINDRGEVVGLSYNSTTGVLRGFHWQGGVMTDINSVLPAGSPLVMATANDINSRGEIAIQAFDPAFGDFVAAVLIPSGNDNVPLGDSAAANTLQRTVILPENVRKLLQKRMRFGPPLK